MFKGPFTMYINQEGGAKQLTKAYENTHAGGSNGQRKVDINLGELKIEKMAIIFQRRPRKQEKFFS